MVLGVNLEDLLVLILGDLEIAVLAGLEGFAEELGLADLRIAALGD